MWLRVFLINTVQMQAAVQPSHEKPLWGMRLMYYPNVNPMTCLKPNFPHFELRYSTVAVFLYRGLNFPAGKMSLLKVLFVQESSFYA